MMKVVGHRGALGLAPANTLAGLIKAVEYKVDEVEIDLSVTKDGVVVLHHDKAINLPNQRLTIKDYVFSDLKKYKSDLASLEEVLNSFSPDDLKLYLEVKPREDIRPIVRLLKKYLLKGWSVDNFKLGSFSQKTLVELHKQLPAIPKIVIESWFGIRANYRARRLGTSYISMNQRYLWFGFIWSVSRSKRLYAYTLNDPKKAKAWAGYGLYAVITDYPDRFN